MILRKYRELRGLSVAQTAEQLGVDRKTVYRWEAGESRPDAHMMERIRDWSDRAVQPNDWFEGQQ